MNKTFELTPEQGYKLMIAALEVASNPSPAVYKRCRRAREKSEPTAFPKISPRVYMDLIETLEEILPGAFENTMQRRHEKSSS